MNLIYSLIINIEGKKKLLQQYLDNKRSKIIFNNKINAFNVLNPKIYVVKNVLFVVISIS